MVDKPVEKLLEEAEIVIIDDEEKALSFARDALALEGKEIKSFQSASKGLEYLLNNKVDLLILDMIMDIEEAEPGKFKDGMWLLKELEKHEIYVPVLVNTAYSRKERAKERNIDYPIIGYLKKSGDPEEFVDKIFTVLRSIDEHNKRLKVEEEKSQLFKNIAKYVAQEFRNKLFPAVGMITVLLGLDKKSYSLELEEKLNNFNEMLKEFSSNKKNIKEVIDNYATLKDEVTKIAFSHDRKLYSALKSIEESLEAIDKIVDYTFLGEKMIKEKICFDEFVSEVLKYYKDVFVSNSIRTRYNFSAQKNVFIVREYLSKIISNLVTNAIESLASNKLIEVSTYVENEYVVFSIKDSGRGINEKDIEKLFDPFFTTKKNAVGIGLAYCKKATELLNGKIIFESVENEGSTFKVYLPIENGE